MKRLPRLAMAGFILPALPAPLALFALLAAAGCSDRLAGGGSETEYLTGNATTPSGASAAGARVFIRPADYLADPATASLPTEHDTVTDAYGAFHVPNLPAGEYAVEIRLGDSLGLLALATVTAKAGAAVAGRLQPLGTLRASIQDPAAGPAAFLQVYGMERRAEADGSGNMSVTMPPGEYRVRIGAGESQETAAIYSRVTIVSGSDTVLAALPAKALGTRPPVPLIFDANIGIAPDDAGALSLLHALADLGEARILAAGSSQNSRFSPSVLDAINTYRGRSGIPLGTWKGEVPASRRGYDSLVAADFPRSRPGWDSLPEAHGLYRQVLSGEPDSSVTLVVTGTLYNVHALLKVDPEMVARKVKHLVMVGGHYPSGREFNFVAGIARDTFTNVVQAVLADWPTPITFIGDESGGDVFTGNCLAGSDSANPVRKIYELSSGQSGSTDLLAALYAVRAARDTAPEWDRVTEGRNQVNADGSNQWLASPDSPQAYLVRKVPPANLAATLQALLCRTPAP